MNGQCLASDRDQSNKDSVNPFVHHLELTSTYEKIKAGILTVVVLPVRLMIICGLLVLAWLLACVGLFGLSEKDLQERPLSPWRRKVRWYSGCVMRGMLFCMGFHRVQSRGKKASRYRAPLLTLAPHSSFFDILPVIYMGDVSIVTAQENLDVPFIGSGKVRRIVTRLGYWTYYAGGMRYSVRGKQAPRHEAPILVIAPHSTFLDAGICYITGMPSIIARRESGLDPFMGKLINFTQPMYVWRDDPNSRHKTIQQIRDRATSSQDWSQILIFPEGTCTNRSCLITFKPGAFYPGVPVQPVILRYPNKLDTVTWTWEGPGALKLMWLTLVQPHSNCEIEFLPVYKPNAEERRDPKLYAENVRQLMARALGVPTCNYTYDDCQLVAKANTLSVPRTCRMLQILKHRIRLGLTRNHREAKLVSENPLQMQEEQPVTFTEFADRLNIPSADPVSQDLFSLLDQDARGRADFSLYLLSVLMVDRGTSRSDMLDIAFQLCGRQGKLNERQVAGLLRQLYQMSPLNAAQLSQDIASSLSNQLVSLSQFESFMKKRPESEFVNNNYGGGVGGHDKRD